MALGSNQMTLTTGDKFIPDLWMAEVRKALESNLVFAKLVKRFDVKGKKGDVFHVPDLSNLTANNKSANTQVTLQSPTETEFTITINTHKETSFLVEDILGLQSNYDLRNMYAQKAGYALAKSIDSSIVALITGTSGQGSVGSAASASASDVTDPMFRDAIETLDVADVPDSPRFAVFYPSQKNAILGIDKFVSADKVGPQNQRITGGSPATKQFGEIYGNPIYFTTQVPTRAAGIGEVDTKRNVLAHEDGLACAIQQDTRVQSAYIQEYLGWLTTADIVYGVAVYRANHIVQILSLV